MGKTRELRQLNVRLAPEDFEALRRLESHLREITPFPLEVGVSDTIRWALHTLDAGLHPDGQGGEKK